MGTNYYMQPLTKCETCGHEPEPVHIGKSSAGWCFSLHVDDDFKSLDDYRKAWSAPGVVLTNEYGDVMTPEEIEQTIVNRSWKPREDPPTREFLDQNHAEPPDSSSRGLLRHRIGRHCVGHGEGTWDLIPGEFS